MKPWFEWGHFAPLILKLNKIERDFGTDWTSSFIFGPYYVGWLTPGLLKIQNLSEYQDLDWFVGGVTFEGHGQGHFEPNHDHFKPN